MGIFDAFAVSGSGLTVARQWMDAISDNLANMNDATATTDKAFQARYVQAQARDYGNESGTSPGGVDVTGVELGSAEGRVVNEPDNPLADADGNVRYPDIDLSEQMGHLIVAQRTYQANASAVDRAKESYQAAIAIGGEVMSLFPAIESLSGLTSANVNGVGGSSTVMGVSGVSGTTLDSTDATTSASGTGFAATLATSLDHVQALQANSADLAVKAATGDLTDVHDYTIAASQAQLATEVTVAIRNKALDAFNEIMRMQV